MNGHVCCILGVCCPPGSAKQREALAKGFKQAVPSLSDAQANEVAVTTLQNFDLAPAGTLTGFKTEIAKLAKTATP